MTRREKLWIAYGKFEIASQNISLAKNVFERAVEVFPRVFSLWDTYTRFLIDIEDFTYAREVFSRWLAWDPEPKAFYRAIALEKQLDVERAAEIFELLIERHPAARHWADYAKLYKRSYTKARIVFRRAFHEAPLDKDAPKLYLDYASAATANGDIDEARSVYSKGLADLPRDDSGQLYDAFMQFEQQHGSEETIAAVVAESRRRVYDSMLDSDNSWATRAELIRLESRFGVERAAAAYRAAVSAADTGLPSSPTRNAWRACLAVLADAVAFSDVTGLGDIGDTAQDILLNAVPHAELRSSKPFTAVGDRALRHQDLEGARQVLDVGLDMTGSPKLFRHYIALETALQSSIPAAELKASPDNKVRYLYHKWADTCPEDPIAVEDLARYECMIAEGDQTQYARALELLAAKGNDEAVPASARNHIWTTCVDMVRSTGASSDSYPDLDSVVSSWIESMESDGISGLALIPDCYLALPAAKLCEVDSRFVELLKSFRESGEDDADDDEYDLRTARSALVAVAQPTVAVREDEALGWWFEDVDGAVAPSTGLMALMSDSDEDEQ
ncbi:Suppressor of forked protein (Suf) [Carpediemonas membranifera]|uniref:Suppressor of forked protein (Suf) n=1 Tax=Carpediemonas membranifera TaxID=201153 RepID=A0A8J6B5M2_9EUKA|nr:Suppressor of forked protein (Suf) [Carpediemonas membranifera]|eukprot:KAG9396168.1 Suppressor of forked protein (Suf) [Carpediemonas membranifera]